MKTIFKNGTYDRVSEEVAESQVKYNGWKYVPKSEWKTATRVPVVEAQVEQAEKKEKTLSKKAQRRINLKEKQRQ